MTLILEAARLLCLILLAGLIIWAMVEDLRDLTIPNRVSILIVALFVPWALLSLSFDAVLVRLAIAGVAFLLTYGMWLAGKFGGGDVKFLSSLMLWVAPLDVPGFLFVLSVVSLVVALALISLRGRARALDEAQLATQPYALRRAYEMARVSACPYAVPIGCAGLMAVMPGLFGH